MDVCRKYFKDFYTFLVEIFFPSTCVGCKTRDSALCDSCSVRLRRAERKTASHIITAFDYRDPIVRRMIWKMKYSKYAHLGIILGEMLYEIVLEDIADITLFAKNGPILVIPVPLSPKKARTRGYNQAEMLARGFCQAGGAELFELRKDIAIKTKDTEPQARITHRSARLANIKNAFALKQKDAVRGKTVFIIDDVTTTGGTLNEIMKLCKSAGVKHVYGLAVAH